jgi:hypothetical protein
MAATKRRSGGRKYGKAASESVERALHEFNEGTLKSGAGRHPKVKSREQAIAIGLSEAREAGAKVPSKRSAAKKSGAKKAGAKKAGAKKGGARKATARKSGAKKGGARKSTRKRATTKKSGSRRGTRRAA